MFTVWLPVNPLDHFQPRPVLNHRRPRPKFTSHEIMMLVFFSSDRLEVERLAQQFTDEGISCEVRNGVRVKGMSPKVSEAELWIRHERDCHRAFLLCVHGRVGFAKRPKELFDLDGWPEVLAA